MSKPIVIAFIPGTTASVLQQPVDTKIEETWPAIMSPKIWANGPRFKKFAQALENNVNATPTDLVDEYPDPINILKQIPCYKSLLEFISNNTTMAQCLPTNLPAEAPDQLFYKIPYDWRVDNAVSAAYVAEKLDLLETLYDDTDYELNLVAHSNGGLVSRYLLEAWLPTQTTKPAWAGKLKQLVTLATPHLGAPLAWKAAAGIPLLDDEPEAAIQLVTSVVDNRNFTSTHELLPPEADGFISNQSGMQDIYTPSPDLTKSFSDFHIDTDNIAAAQRFQQALDPTKSDIPYTFLYGYGATTKKGHGTLANDDKITAFGFDPSGTTVGATFPVAEANGDGDTVVPAQSASGGTQAEELAKITTQGFPGYTHGQMGGSDMDGNPNSIKKMLELCGVAISAGKAQAAE